MNTIVVNTDTAARREAVDDSNDCVVVDDFLQDPRQLVSFAASNASRFSSGQSSYPGQLLRVDASTMVDVYRFIRFEMSKHYPFLKGGLDFWSYLSIVTRPPTELSYLQRICHTDPERNPARAPYAAIIYLFDNEDLGGTGFYRWKERSLVKQAEALGRNDPELALSFLQRHFPTFRDSSRYMTETNEIAELLCTIPARFNRMVFYSGDVPHSGAITAPELLSPDVLTGRLTLNVFISVVPQHQEGTTH